MQIESTVSHLTEQTGKIHIVLSVSRPGCKIFSTRLEHEIYPPRTPANENMQISILTWPDDIKLFWMIVTIPERDQQIACDIARECGLEVKRGCITVLGPTVETFPLQGDNVFSVENLPGNPVYKNVRLTNMSIEDQENAACDSILEADILKFKQELRDEGLTEEQIESTVREAMDERFE